ncbi:MAG: DNA repair protein RadC [Candidatus Wildermuthbacteria bacterium]|nr:DNA repair protein RadC [Candidatus Wildermuthbacteria bacterium]
MKQSFTVQDLPVPERPRERLTLLGPEALSAQELLALILGRGIQGEPVMMISQRLLSSFGSLEGVISASLEDLRSVRGVGVAKATQLKACLEISRRSQAKDERQDKKDRRRVISSRDAYELVKGELEGYAKERFVVLSFDVRNMFLGADTVSVGTLNASLVHPRETFEVAIRRHAHHIIVAHNHPSGDPEPSLEDREITRRLVQAGKILGIEVADHVIIGKSGYTSFRDLRML